MFSFYLLVLTYWNRLYFNPILACRTGVIIYLHFSGERRQARESVVRESRARKGHENGLLVRDVPPKFFSRFLSLALKTHKLSAYPLLYRLLET